MDLNSDLGERAAPDAALLAIVTSANVACGAHAGDAEVMRATVREAHRLGVAIGAHPGYADREHFGRRELGLAPDEIEALVASQVRALLDVCTREGARLRYVKPHGALYNRAVVDAEAARAVARAVLAVSPRLMLLGLAGSAMLREGERLGLRVAGEAFADRGYRADGTLLPRGTPGAILTDPDLVAARAVRIAEEGVVEADDGSLVRLRADSLCVHGDTPGALALAAAVRERLTTAGVPLAPFAP